MSCDSASGWDVLPINGGESGCYFQSGLFEASHESAGVVAGAIGVIFGMGNWCDLFCISCY